LVHAVCPKAKQIIYKTVMHHTMKTVTLFLLILISSSCFSQDSRLFEQTWILHDLIIDGQSNVPPINSEQNHIPADFIEPDEFTTGVCDGTGGYGEIIYNGATEFSIPDGMFWLAGSCNLTENNIYAGLYQGFWDLTWPDPFQYEIIYSGQERMLTVTASNENQAIYSNNFLSTNEFKSAHLRIYPNPVNGIINLEYAEDISVTRIRIYDFYGRKVLVQKKNMSQIVVQNLTAGIYFISIENDENKIITKKFVKQ
jgi:Secretion system C-terminal sorting domain